MKVIRQQDEDQHCTNAASQGQITKTLGNGLGIDKHLLTLSDG